MLETTYSFANPTGSRAVVKFVVKMRHKSYRCQAGKALWKTHRYFRPCCICSSAERRWRRTWKTATRGGGNRVYLPPKTRRMKRDIVNKLQDGSC